MKEPKEIREKELDGVRGSEFANGSAFVGTGPAVARDNPDA